MPKLRRPTQQRPRHIRCGVCGADSEAYVGSRYWSHGAHGADAATRDTLVVDIFQDRRQPGHRMPLQANPPLTNPLPPRTAVHFGIPFSQNVTGSCLPNFAERQQWASRAAESPNVPLRGQSALKELSVVTSPGLSCANFVAACCWQKFPRGPTETQN